MAKIPDDIRAFMNAHEVREDELWPVPGGKSFAIKHGALERIAARNKISFMSPEIIERDSVSGHVAIVVHASMGDERTWSFGEASPKNNKNAYPWAMAEKRAKDRCTLKLLNAHGAIYSEDEADDFKQQSQPPKIAMVEQPTTDSMAYVTISLGIIRTFKSSAEDLSNWWLDEKRHREELGIVKGTPEYTTLFDAIAEKGKALKARMEQAA